MPWPDGRGQFARLALSREPATRAEVDPIADHFGLNADALAALIDLA